MCARWLPLLALAAAAGMLVAGASNAPSAGVVKLGAVRALTPSLDSSHLAPASLGTVILVRESHMGTPGGAWLLRLDSRYRLQPLRTEVEWSTHISSNGRAIAYLGRGGVCIRDLITNKVTRFPLSGVMGFAWSPDGGTLAMANGRDVLTAPRDSSSARLIARLPTTEHVRNVRWSSDGTQLAAVAMVSGTFEVRRIWTMDADGSHLQAVTTRLAGTDDVTWSPNGKKLAFTTSHLRGLNSDLWILDLRSRIRRHIGTGSVIKFSPVDEMFLIQRWRKNDALDLSVGDAAGRTRVLSSAAWTPIWSYDGRWIAFFGSRGLEAVSVDGQRSLTLLPPSRFPDPSSGLGLADWIKP